LNIIEFAIQYISQADPCLYQLIWIIANYPVFRAALQPTEGSSAKLNAAQLQRWSFQVTYYLLQAFSAPFKNKKT
jgi:hypothetical protein